MGDQKRKQRPEAKRAEGRPKGASQADREKREVSEITAIKADLEQAKSEASEYLGLLQRVKAEFENYKKRIIREQTQFLESASQELVKALLPLMDNLERALEAGSETEDYQDLAAGVAMIYSQMREIFVKEGLGEINPEGEPFDPAYHEAVLALEHPEAPANTVVEVFRKGYQFKGKVLRPAAVTVAREPVSGQEHEEQRRTDSENNSQEKERKS